MVWLVTCLLGIFVDKVTCAGVYGADVSSPTSEAAWACLKSQHGVRFAVARAYTESGLFDDACVESVKNARAAGLSPVDVYFFPAFYHKAANASVDQFHSSMTSHGVHANRVWLDIEGPQYWGPDHQRNNDYILDLYYRLKSQGYIVGVYTSDSQWVPITGDSKILSFLPVWYAAYETPQEPNFNDWRPFGGWSRPSIKQFRGTHSECGASIDANWHP